MGGKVDPKDTWWLKSTSSNDNMIDVNGTEEFLQALKEAGDRLVIVDFYARWCGACRGLFPKLCKIASQEENKDILFVKVEFDDNKEMCRSMGVKILPFFHFYKCKEGKVEEFSASISKIKLLREKIEKHHPAPVGDKEAEPVA